MTDVSDYEVCCDCECTPFRRFQLPEVVLQHAVLCLEVLLDAFGTAFAAETGVLDAAERGAGVRDEPLIQAHHPGLERLHDAVRAVETAGERVGDQSVLGPV